jgi:hypothetical protein
MELTVHLFLHGSELIEAEPLVAILGSFLKRTRGILVAKVVWAQKQLVAFLRGKRSAVVRVGLFESLLEQTRVISPRL